MKILVAEDDPVSRRLLVKILEKWGYETLLAADGVEAWELFQANPVKMAITDWMMPGLDGPGLCRRIRGSPGGEYPYLILLTSKSDKQSLVDGMEAGADDFVTKPFERQELGARIRAGTRILDLQAELQDRIRQLAELNQTIAQTNQRMREDLEAAAAIQKALLPEHLPESDEVRFAWEYRPCTELGGDCLGVFPLDRNHIGLFVLDVAGHGVPAALLSVTLSRLLVPRRGERSILSQPVEGSGGPRITPPAEVAEELNRRFPLDEETLQYFTLLYGTLNRETGEFRYTTAGQPGPLYLPAGGSPAVLAGYNLPIGFSDDPRYEEHSVILQPGDRMYLFTDGIIEAHSPAREQFGVSGLSDLLMSNRTGMLAHGLASLVESVEAWCADGELEDDVSILAVEMTGAALRAGAVPEALAQPGSRMV